MKKKYTAPQTAIMKADTESIMLQGSIRIGSYKDAAKSKEYDVVHNRYDFSAKGIQFWTGTEQPETAKDNGGSLWEDEY